MTGTQLGAALLPISDFPPGYQLSVYYDSGSSLTNLAYELGIAGCKLGRMPDIVGQNGYFYPEFGTALATHTYAQRNQASGIGYLYLSQAVFQFASPTEAEAFFSYARTCLIDNKTWSNGVDTAPVNGDQAITADLTSAGPTPGENSATEPLFVLHGTDVFDLSAASQPSAGPLTIPGAAELIAELIARVDALSPAPFAGSSLAPSAGSSLPPSAVAAPALPSRKQAAQALAALLAQSGTDRAAVTQAVGAVADCSPGLSQDETTFSTAASSREALLGKLAALPGRSALPASMLQDLTTAWRASGQADQDFAGWAQDEISHGCSTSYQSDASHQAAMEPDDQATTYKKAFAALWTAIANEYGLPSYQYNQI